MSHERRQLDGSSLPSTEEAKLGLLEWSIDADAQMHQQINAWVATAKQTVRAAAPWAAGAALLGGFFFGSKRRGRGGRDGEQKPRGLGGSFGSILKIAMDVAPIVMGMMRRRDEPRQ